jgi:hypothetical protein
VKPLSLDPDRWGTIASTLCAVHCAITGIAVSVFSIIGFSAFQSPAIEWGFVTFALTFGCWAASRGFRIHHSWQPIAIFLVGFSLLVISRLVSPNRSSGFVELFSVFGGVSLIWFHALNQRLIKSKC